MNADRWARIKDLFSLAIERGETHARDILEAARSDDPALASEVESLGREHFRLEAAAQPRDEVPGPSLNPTRFRQSQGIGGGTFGDVYKVYDTGRGEFVALKILREHNAAPLLYFKREFRSLVDLRHPNLVKLHEMFSDASQWMFTMELVEGQNYLDFIRRSDAPVSYPCLWDTPQHDHVQWNGTGSSRSLAILRNVGEALGVFGTVDVAPRPLVLPGYRSSIGPNLTNLKRLEDSVRDLYSPLWPRTIKEIDPAKSARGELIYRDKCKQCHAFIDRKDPGRLVTASMHSLSDVGNDPKMAVNFAERTGDASYSAAVIRERIRRRDSQQRDSRHGARRRVRKATH